MPKNRSSKPALSRMATIHALGHPNSPAPRTAWARQGRNRAGDTIVPAVIGTPFIPNTPDAPVLLQGSAGEVNVSWTIPPIDASHGLATGFSLRYSPAGTATWTIVPNVASPWTLTGLPPGTAFDVEVFASNPNGGSGWSAPASLATAPAGPFAPNAPEIARVSPPGDGTTGKLAVSWTAPASDTGHDAATGYNLRYSLAGAANWTVASGVASPHILTGLSGAVAIDVQVQATNAAASPGAWSATATGTTWGATVTQGGWVAAASQVHGTGVSPNGGVQLTAVAAPAAVTGAAFAWSLDNSVVPTSGLIAAGPNGQANGWGQWFDAPATPGTYYLWLLALGTGGVTTGALATSAIAVT